MRRRSRSRKGTGLSEIGTVLRGVLRKNNIGQEARVFGFWNRAVPGRIARNAQPTRLYRGTLHVNTSTTIWAHELSMLQDDLLARIKAHAPRAGVKSLRFRVGPLPAVLRIIDEEKPPPVPPLRPVAIPEDIGVALSRVNNDGLRRVMQEALRASLCRADQREAGEL